MAAALSLPLSPNVLQDLHNYCIQNNTMLIFMHDTAAQIPKPSPQSLPGDVIAIGTRCTPTGLRDTPAIVKITPVQCPKFAALLYAATLTRKKLKKQRKLCAEVAPSATEIERVLKFLKPKRKYTLREINLLAQRIKISAKKIEYVINYILH